MQKFAPLLIKTPSHPYIFLTTLQALLYNYQESREEVIAILSPLGESRFLLYDLTI